MSRSFNQVIIMGNLTRDPELRTTTGGQNVCNFTLALNRSYKDSSGDWKEVTDYIDVIAWGPLGERVNQYLKKGSQALVNGRLQYRAWEQDGQKRNKVEVVAADVTFLGGKGDGGGSAGSQTPQQSTSAPAPKKDNPSTDISDEPIDLSEIPF